MRRNSSTPCGRLCSIGRRRGGEGLISPTASLLLQLEPISDKQASHLRGISGRRSTVITRRFSARCSTVLCMACANYRISMPRPCRAWPISPNGRRPARARIGTRIRSRSPSRQSRQHDARRGRRRHCGQRDSQLMTRLTRQSVDRHRDPAATTPRKIDRREGGQPQRLAVGRRTRSSGRIERAATAVAPSGDQIEQYRLKGRGRTDSSRSPSGSRRPIS